MSTQITTSVYPKSGEQAFLDADHVKLDGIEAEAKKYPDTGEQAFLDADHVKLDGIEAEAKKYPDTGEQAFLDADHTKLDGIETGADITDAANIASSGASMRDSVQDITLLDNGSITPDGSRLLRLETYGGAATDDLIHIFTTNYHEGDIVTLCDQHNTHDVTVRDVGDGGSNLNCEGNASFAIIGTNHNISFICLDILGTLSWMEYRRFTG